MVYMESIGAEEGLIPTHTGYTRDPIGRPCKSEWLLMTASGLLRNDAVRPLRSI